MVLRPFSYGHEIASSWEIHLHLQQCPPNRHNLLVRFESCRAPIESLSSRWPRLQTNLKDLWPEFAGHKQPAAHSVVGNPIQGRMQRL